MAHKKASRPTPIAHSFVSKFGGEICPICKKNRLAAILKYPVCNRCRKKYDITEKMLQELTEHRFLISTGIIDWQQKPHPTISGSIDDAPWKASFVLNNQWFVELRQPGEDHLTIRCLIRQYLESITPAWLERAKGKTKIRRYAFFVATGASIVTAGYFLKKRADRLEREKKEAEEAESS